MFPLNKKTCSSTLDKDEAELIQKIKHMTKACNVDNISRTEAYFDYYIKFPEICWSFLASMVSRNAGWNMCDLEGLSLPKIIKKKFRTKLFLTYERANWLIFQDAYPQLLLYQYSTKIKRPMFHLLSFFHVSSFMEQEWNCFWKEKNVKRLLYSLIINEQNVIQQPVIKHPHYKMKVFYSPIFLFQDWFHFSAVIFPTCHGELYGASVHGFKSVTERINLGKRLAHILFKKELFPNFFEFACRTVHTGSRYDYEYYFNNGTKRTTPFLRCTYPAIKHRKQYMKDWSAKTPIKRRWLKFAGLQKYPIEMTDWYLNKQRQMNKAIYILSMMK
ncbi:DUF2515 domain-containing protein [Bacillus sp. Bva_UNVM-123]|uniref:DUF2515 domain-containing protein n=1 Tax=Bacillus sp. Bva_UNVM-123 TaxID=2829798 RepID=UPI00391F1BBA